MRIRELLFVADNAHRQVMEAGFRIELLLERQMALMRSNISAPLTQCYPGLSSMYPCAVRSAKDRLENGESAVPMLRPTNSNGKFVTLSGGAEHENLEEGEFIEVAETDGFHVEKAFADKEQTNNTSPKIAATNLSNNFKQNADELQGVAREGNGRSLLKSTHESAKENGDPPSNLARPLENVSGAKRKVDTQPPEVGAVSKIPLTGAKKKLKQEFSCELCQVVVSSEQVFNGHLQGNKHKKAAARREKFALGLVPKARPLENVSGVKCTADTQPPEVGALSKIPSTGAKKKCNQEFICELCKVVVSSEQMTQHADDLKKETVDKKDLALKVAQKSNDSEGGNGNFAEMVSKIGDGNKNCKLVFNLEKVGARTGKVMDDEKKREMHLRKPLEDCSRGEFQAEKATSMEKETNSGTKNNSNPVQLTQCIYDSMKGNVSSTDTMMKTEDGNGYVSNSCDNSLMLAVNQNTSDSMKGNGSSIDTVLRTGDKNMTFKFSCKICKAGPLENVSGAKHKADAPPPEVGAVSKIPSTGAKKKLKQEFSCELCQVVVSSEHVFNGHLQGNKHKKAAARQEKFALGLVPKLTLNTCKPAKDNSNLAEKLKIGDENKRYKFVCRICKVCFNTESARNFHYGGQGHLEKLQLDQNGAPKEKPAM